MMEQIHLEQVLPAQIERRSFEIIGQELAAMGRTLPAEEAPVTMRVIHTTADFEYAEHLVFSKDAVKQGIAALKAGARIVTDTNMGLAGVNKKALARLGGEAVCFMADEEVAEAARAKGTTRASASMDKAAALWAKDTSRPLLFALGNAPTALIRLYELIRGGSLSPALVIGVPVGFVNVVQSKELILTLPQTPYIVARGRKGGSGVAAAICNALLYEAAGRS